ncbi:hypothetical protein CLAIMM_04451 [Cladophialophora immunda]|nr:hypothetical protein CLAIMM_04451 [Cladophialophora immunda]
MGTRADCRPSSPAKRSRNQQDLKEEQKRMRNRLSQKAIRERRSAYIEQLEAKVAFLSQQESVDPSSELWQRNEALQDSLRALRKKLLSISTTIIGLSDSVLPILNSSKTAETEGESSILTRPTIDSPPAPAMSSPDAVLHSSDDGVSMNINGSHDGSQSAGPVNLDFLTTSTDSPSCHDDMAKLGADPWMMSSKTGSSNTGGVLADWNWSDSSFHVLGGASSQPAQLQNYLGKELDFTEAAVDAVSLPLVSLSERALVQKTSNLSDHLQYVCDLVQLSSLPSRFTSAPYIMNDLLHALFHVAWPFMDYWVTWTNSCGLIVPILWWQATRTEAARMAIAPIYRPTLMQMMTPCYPKVIDWVPHAALRDSLISTYMAYDLDTMICHLTEAYVKEPGVGESSASSLNVMDLVLTSLNSGHGASGFTTSQPDLLFAYPTTAASPTCSHSTPPTDSQMHRFKIDPSFVAKYSHLYHPSAVAKQTVARPAGVPKLAPPSPLTPATMRVATLSEKWESSAPGDIRSSTRRHSSKINTVEEPVESLSAYDKLPRNTAPSSPFEVATDVIYSSVKTH